MAASSLQPLQAGSSFLVFYVPSTTLAPASASLPSKDGHTQSSWPSFREKELSKVVTEVRCVVCAGQSELTAIVGGVLAAALLIAAVVAALVCCKKSKREKYSSKR